MKIKDIVTQALVHLQSQMRAGHHLESCIAISDVTGASFYKCPAVAKWSEFCDSEGPHRPEWWGESGCTDEGYRARVNKLKAWASKHGEEEI